MRLCEVMCTKVWLPVEAMQYLGKLLYGLVNRFRHSLMDGVATAETQAAKKT